MESIAGGMAATDSRATDDSSAETRRAKAEMRRAGAHVAFRWQLEHISTIRLWHDSAQ
jgi:hypothetical protein